MTFEDNKNYSTLSIFHQIFKNYKAGETLNIKYKGCQFSFISAKNETVLVEVDNKHVGHFAQPICFAKAGFTLEDEHYNKVTHNVTDMKQISAIVDFYDYEDSF
ncbi:hypothetical protein [Staphylococcus pseudintermedius]|uniref:hypothetical protein n=1 Tax=Staphylococcus pseudintermedius TaxID=283734 RepID=UPI0019345936|nr:hypothetical protein [Staphylococcus pseudintermedius]EGQ4060140.1 hypothetical protein [Staphylococcus pseudintermedius]EJD8533336.1 hypothetical protein [Staphylococcus pseudintermedius]MBM0287823.1 hypothetical protein [Staphylococcus pseudintermedius]